MKKSIWTINYPKDRHTSSQQVMKKHNWPRCLFNALCLLKAQKQQKSCILICDTKARNGRLRKFTEFLMAQTSIVHENLKRHETFIKWFKQLNNVRTSKGNQD